MPTQVERLTAVDLFCGCGGLTTGLQMAGFRVVAAVEKDSVAATTYSANHPTVAVWQQDIRDVEPADLLRVLGLKSNELDLLAGCPPCQGFSTLRTLNGRRRIDDSRNDLVSEFERFVRLMRPRAVMMENVPGLGRDPRFLSLCLALQALGYAGAHKILDAADYGVPQRRRRLIYIAGRERPIPFAPPARERITVRDVLSGLPRAGLSGDAPHDIPERRSSRTMQIIRSIPKDGGSRHALPKHLQLACHRRCSGFHDVYGRIRWNDVAPTVTTGCFNPSKGRFLHPEEDRAITVREAALLQGFPAAYRFAPLHGKEALAAMIGNALPPPFVAAHSRSIRDALRSRKLRVSTSA